MTNAAVGRAARCCGGGNNRHLLVKVTQITRRPSREFQKKISGGCRPPNPPRRGYCYGRGWRSPCRRAALTDPNVDKLSYESSYSRWCAPRAHLTPCAHTRSMITRYRSTNTPSLPSMLRRTAQRPRRRAKPRRMTFMGISHTYLLSDRDMGASVEMREASSAARVRVAVRLALEANSRSRSCTRAMHRSTVTVTTCGHTVSIRANSRRSIHVSFCARHVRENRESRPDRVPLSHLSRGERAGIVEIETQE